MSLSKRALLGLGILVGRPRIDSCHNSCYRYRVGLILGGLLLALGPCASGAIFGHDDRIEVVDAPRVLRAASESVAVLIHEKYLRHTKTGFELTQSVESYGQLFNLCSEERFAEQLSPAFCSGFLLDDGRFVTAGHCLEYGGLEHTVVVFGFSVDGQYQRGRAAFLPEQVFRIRRVLQVSTDPDFSFSELDRLPPFGGMALATQQPRVGQEVAVIGAPHGIPVKIAGGAQVQLNSFSETEHYFEANLDIFAGSSGSPVVDVLTGHVLGILVTGFGEFEASQRGGCERLRRFATESDGVFPWVTRLLGR